MGFFIIYVILQILEISGKSETWSPEPVRFATEHTIYSNTRALRATYNSSHLIISASTAAISLIFVFYSELFEHEEIDS